MQLGYACVHVILLYRLIIISCLLKSRILLFMFIFSINQVIVWFVKILKLVKNDPVTVIKVTMFTVLVLSN